MLSRWGKSGSKGDADKQRTIGAQVCLPPSPTTPTFGHAQRKRLLVLDRGARVEHASHIVVVGKVEEAPHAGGQQARVLGGACKSTKRKVGRRGRVREVCIGNHWTAVLHSGATWHRQAGWRCSGASNQRGTCCQWGVWGKAGRAAGNDPAAATALQVIPEQQQPQKRHLDRPTQLLAPQRVDKLEGPARQGHVAQRHRLIEAPKGTHCE